MPGDEVVRVRNGKRKFGKGRRGSFCRQEYNREFSGDEETQQKERGHNSGAVPRKNKTPKRNLQERKNSKKSIGSKSVKKGEGSHGDENVGKVQDKRRNARKIKKKNSGKESRKKKTREST